MKNFRNEISCQINSYEAFRLIRPLKFTKYYTSYMNIKKNNVKPNLTLSFDAANPIMIKTSSKNPSGTGDSFIFAPPDDYKNCVSGLLSHLSDPNQKWFALLEKIEPIAFLKNPLYFR